VSRITTLATIALACAGGVGVWYVAQSELRSRWSAALAALAAAGTLLWLPGQVHNALSDARTYHRIGRMQADNAAAISLGLDPHTYERIRALVPPHATMYVTGSGKFRFWAFTDLLPRLAVDNPQNAEWALTAKPALDLPGVRFARIYHLHNATLGRIAP
jgi:hypothetical protein